MARRKHRNTTREVGEQPRARPIEQLFELLVSALELRAGEPVSVTLAAATAEPRLFHMTNVEKEASIKVLRATCKYLEQT